MTRVDYIPVGWRQMEIGEVIQNGDYFNSNSMKEGEKPNWVRYKHSVGSGYESAMVSIRPSLWGMVPEGADESWHTPASIPAFKTTKEKVAEYLQKCLTTPV